MLIQYQLFANGKNWDQFLVDNGFGHTEFWPPAMFKSWEKRRKLFFSEASVLKPSANPQEINYIQPSLSKDLGANMIEGNPMSMSGGFVDLQPVQVVKIPTQNPKRLVMSQNIDSILFDGLKPKPRESVSICAHRFTRSMTTIVITTMIQ